MARGPARVRALTDWQQDLAAAVLAPAPPAAAPFAARGLAVYHEAYRLRLLEVLGADYPVLARLVGAQAFRALACGYIESHRSTHYSVRWYGQAFARHVLRHAARDERRVLAEIARLEWLLGEAFDAADAALVGPEALGSLAPAAWPGARLRLHPAVRRLRVHARTLVCWQWARDEGAREGRPSLSPAEDETWSMLLVWRAERRVQYRVLDHTEAQVLRHALSGADFATICAALAMQYAAVELPAVIARLFAAWLASGLVSAVTVDG